MKHTTRIFALFALCTVSLAVLRAAPFAGDTPVHASPDPASPVLLTLGAGTEPSPATSASTAALPEGWEAIAITASIDVWVRDSDLNKELDVRPGAILRAEPNPDSPSVGTMVAGDITELRGIQGKWVQMHVTKKTTGYINTSASAPVTPVVPATPVTPAGAPSQPAAAPAPDSKAVQPAPSTPPPPQPASTVPYAPNQTAAPSVQQPLSVAAGASSAQTTRPTGAPAAPIGGGRTYEAKPADASSAAIPRTFEGVFASTRRALMPRRPYEFQLTASDGTRLAYLDLDKITATEQFENYIGRTVIVNGSMEPVPNTQDIVIKAETLQAK